MVRIFKTADGALEQLEEPADGCWIALTDPTATEIFEIAQKFGIEVDDLRVSTISPQTLPYVPTVFLSRSAEV